MKRPDARTPLAVYGLENATAGMGALFVGRKRRQGGQIRMRSTSSRETGLSGGRGGRWCGSFRVWPSAGRLRVCAIGEVFGDAGGASADHVVDVDLGHGPAGEAPGGALGGSAGAVTALLEAGADPNVRDVTGSTPLHHARTAEAVTALLEARADPNARDADGKLPFDYAGDNEQIKGTDAYWRLNDARFQ